MTTWTLSSVLKIVLDSHRDGRRSDDHYEREKREADWNFQKDSFFCEIPSELINISAVK